MRAIHAALKKTLWWDIIRHKKRPAALCSNDAKSCYDRMVHVVTMMSMVKMGAPIPAMVSMFETLQNLEVVIRTAFGDSARSYKKERRDP